MKEKDQGKLSTTKIEEFDERRDFIYGNLQESSVNRKEWLLVSLSQMDTCLFGGF